jgi:hypothetical protein
MRELDTLGALNVFLSSPVSLIEAQPWLAERIAVPDFRWCSVVLTPERAIEVREVAKPHVERDRADARA